MQFLDVSFQSPAENLACDEALLESAARGQTPPTLRFWESPTYFVTLGYTNRAAQEANLAVCAARGVAVLRRCSGGGTVLQGPGCLNYALVYPIPPGSALQVTATNDFVMETNRRALQNVMGVPVERAGQTDLAIGGRKFSGNAQKRKPNYFLFHGTLLLDFDLELVQTLLLAPPKQPDYRAHRSHLEFIRNLGVSRESIKTALREAWSAEAWNEKAWSEKLEENSENPQKMRGWPRELTQNLVAQKYARPEWNLKF